MQSTNSKSLLNALSALAVISLLISGCCAYDPVLYGQLGKCKTDVAKAYKTAKSNDIDRAREDLNQLVAVAQKDQALWCPEPASQAQDIKAIFDGTDFKRKGTKFYEHKRDNVAEAIDKAIETQDRLKK